MSEIVVNHVGVPPGVLLERIVREGFVRFAEAASTAVSIVFWRSFIAAGRQGCRVPSEHDRDAAGAEGYGSMSRGATIRRGRIVAALVIPLFFVVSLAPATQETSSPNANNVGVPEVLLRTGGALAMGPVPASRRDRTRCDDTHVRDRRVLCGGESERNLSDRSSDKARRNDRLLTRFHRSRDAPVSALRYPTAYRGNLHRSRPRWPGPRARSVRFPAGMGSGHYRKNALFSA